MRSKRRVCDRHEILCPFCDTINLIYVLRKRTSLVVKEIKESGNYTMDCDRSREISVWAALKWVRKEEMISILFSTGVVFHSRFAADARLTACLASARSIKCVIRFDFGTVRGN
jgi:hypothetical protein